ncbi:hypothetical protein LR002_01365, partial [Candidatus Gracilibacteria bacterium]|nr:hypothetical protein [Candidatus Gracilibacteria bacterium]
MFKKILNFLFPQKCSGCGIFGESLCKNCLEKILERDKKFFNLDEKNKIFQKIYSPFFYKKNPILKKILKEIKYKNKFSKFSGLEEKIFDEFKNFLQQILEKTCSKNTQIYLIPIPMHWKKFLKKGFNQSEIFCDFLEKKGLGKKINLIKKTKNTKPQAQCSKKERVQNLQNAFKINEKHLQNFDLKNGIFIIVDDVLSTGSTMKNCGIEIKNKFSELKIFGFVICSD